MLDRTVADPADPAALHSWRSRMLELAGRRDELESLLRRRAEAAATDELAPWIELVSTQARLGRGRDALEVTIGQALERTPGTPRGSSEARLRLAANDPAGADAALQDALAARPDDPALLIDAASFYEQTNRPGLAEPLLEHLIALGTAADPARLQLAVLLANRAAGDPETWSRALTLAGPEGGDPDHRLARAMVLSRSPDPDRRQQAVTELQALVADLPVMHPRAVEARDQLARLLIVQGHPDQAAQVTAVSAEQAAATDSAVALHARALLLAGRPLDASRQLDRLDLLRPGDPEAAELRTRLLLTDDGPAGLERAALDRLAAPGGPVFVRAACFALLNDGSSPALEAASRLAPALSRADPASTWLDALVLAVLDRPDAALDRAAEALDHVPPTDFQPLAEAVLQAIQAAPVADRAAAVDRARPILDELLRRRPGDTDLMIADAVLDHQAGDYQAEADGLRRVLDRSPDEPMALYNLALVLSEGLDRPDEALPVIDRLLARSGENAAFLGARGVILTRLGRLDDAIGDLERAVTLSPTADRHYYLARAYHKAGRDGPFREHLQQARDAGLDPDAIDPWQLDEFRRLLALAGSASSPQGNPPPAEVPPAD